MGEKKVRNYANPELTSELMAARHRERNRNLFPDFMKTIKTGNAYWLTQDQVGIEKDLEIDNPILFKVIKLRRYTCDVIQVKASHGYQHRISIGYNTLFCMSKRG